MFHLPIWHCSQPKISITHRLPVMLQTTLSGRFFMGRAPAYLFQRPCCLPLRAFLQLLHPVGQVGGQLGQAVNGFHDLA